MVILVGQTGTCAFGTHIGPEERMQRLLSREQLFDLVRSRPILDIAPEYGVSDVALAKFCRQHDLPLPGRGYWARLKRRLRPCLLVG